MMTFYASKFYVCLVIYIYNLKLVPHSQHRFTVVYIPTGRQGRLVISIRIPVELFRSRTLLQSKHSCVVHTYAPLPSTQSSGQPTIKLELKLDNWSIINTDVINKGLVLGPNLISRVVRFDSEQREIYLVSATGNVFS